MAVTHLKSAASAHHAEDDAVGPAVERMLKALRSGGEEAAQRLAADLDGWTGPVRVAPDAIAAAAARVPEAIKDDIRFAHDNIRRFAQMQRAALTDAQVELHPGFVAGQRQIPVSAAGAYVPGGRYSHVASALMTVTTAKVAGVAHVSACSPPRDGGLPDAILYALDLAGADAVLSLGGVQGIAAMAFGLFGLPPADVLVGPGNAYVAEAKRQLFGEVGIDMVAGPTDSLILADASADPDLVAADLVGQAEHGRDSPVWLVTDDRPLAEAVMARVPALAAALPAPNRACAEAAWRERGEVILCDTRDEMAATSDALAPEHLQVMAADLDWWLGRLRSYGSLFLGAETTVAFGDKAAGPNHVLPTSRAARYTGGLSVAKFLKTVTWQRATPAGARPIAEATARISRLEGMEGHARTADLRLAADLRD
ncbi:MAG: histidinol dehydrogenase [Paracoccaceae bacterium]